jgi:rRNA maturation protein Nop10
MTGVRQESNEPEYRPCRRCGVYLKGGPGTCPQCGASLAWRPYGEHVDSPRRFVSLLPFGVLGFVFLLLGVIHSVWVWFGGGG